MRQKRNLRLVEQSIPLPVGEGLSGEELSRFQCVPHLGHIPVEAAHIEVIHLSARRQGFAPLGVVPTKPLIVLLDLLIHIAQCLDDHRSFRFVVFHGVELRQLRQELQHGHGDGSIGWETLQPAEATIFVLQFLQLPHRQLPLVVGSVQVEQQAEALFAYGLVLRLHHPRGLFQQDIFQLLVAVQCGL